LQAFFSIPFIVFQCYGLTLRYKRKSSFILTHYTTLFLSFFLPSSSSIIFCQDIEWLFVPPRSPFRLVLRSMIIYCYARASCIVCTTVQLQRYFSRILPKSIKYFIHPIDTQDSRIPKYDYSDFSQRDFDVLIILRKSWRKNSELSLLLLQSYARYWSSFGITFAVVNATGSDIGLSEGVCKSFYFFNTLPHKSMLELYRCSRLLFFPSLHEGFGLPVLEATNAGCIPILFRNHGSSSFIPADYQYYLSHRQNVYSILCTLRNALSISSGDYICLFAKLVASVNRYHNATRGHAESLSKLTEYIKS